MAGRHGKFQPRITYGVTRGGLMYLSVDYEITSHLRDAVLDVATHRTGGMDYTKLV
jgi:hypothetical protein